MKKEHAIYQVALKILFRKGDEFLFLEDAVRKHWDLPGGRIDNNEQDIPLSEIIDREVKEELGEDIKYQLGYPAFQFRRHFLSKGFSVFITVYEAEFTSGKIILSGEHSNYHWINFRKK